MVSPPGALRPEGGAVVRDLAAWVPEPWARENAAPVWERPTSAQFSVWKFPAHAASARCGGTRSGLKAEHGFGQSSDHQGARRLTRFDRCGDARKVRAPQRSLARPGRSASRAGAGGRTTAEILPMDRKIETLPSGAPRAGCAIAARRGRACCYLRAASPAIVGQPCCHTMRRTSMTLRLFGSAAGREFGSASGWARSRVRFGGVVDHPVGAVGCLDHSIVPRRVPAGVSG